MSGDAELAMWGEEDLMPAVSAYSATDSVSSSRCGLSLGGFFAWVLWGHLEHVVVGFAFYT